MITIDQIKKYIKHYRKEIKLESSSVYLKVYIIHSLRIIGMLHYNDGEYTPSSYTVAIVVGESLKFAEDEASDIFKFVQHTYDILQDEIKQKALKSFVKELEEI